MRLSSPFIQIALSLQMTLSPMAWGQARESKDSNRRAQITFGRTLADELMEYLKRGQADLQKLRAQLRQVAEQAPPTAAHCRSQSEDPACFFLKDVPQMHRRLRLYLAFSFAPNMNPFSPTKIETAGNPQMFSVPMGPLDDRFEALSPVSHRGQPSEIEIAQLELDEFWDNPTTGRIEAYMKVLESKIELLDNNPSLQNQLVEYAKQFVKSRAFASARARIDAAFLIGDPVWRQFRNSELAAMHRRNKVVAWKLVDQFRFLRYLTKARPTASQLDESLSRSLQDNQDLFKRILRAKEALVDFEDLETFRAASLQQLRAKHAAEQMIWLLKFHSFAQKVAKDHPELHAAARSMRAKIDRDEMKATAILSTALLAPVVLLFPPAMVALGAVGTTAFVASGVGASAWMVLDSAEKYKEYRQRYLARSTPDMNYEELATGEEIRRAQRDLWLSPFALALALGLPTFRPGTLIKSP